jgi:hypothetical protein
MPTKTYRTDIYSEDALALAAWIELATGVDPLLYDDETELFAPSEHEACERCHKVRATAMLIVDWAGDAEPERLCLDCASA